MGLIHYITVIKKNVMKIKHSGKFRNISLHFVNNVLESGFCRELHAYKQILNINNIKIFLLKESKSGKVF